MHIKYLLLNLEENFEFIIIYCFSYLYMNAIYVFNNFFYLKSYGNIIRSLVIW